MLKEKKIGIITGLSSELKVLADRDVLSLNGFGPKESKVKALELSKENLCCIISFGFAGSLKKNVKNGEIFLPKEIVWRDGKVFKISLGQRNKFKKKLTGISFKSDRLFSTNQIISNKVKKKYIYEKYNTAIVDMESESIQKIAFQKKIPFLCLRVVLDENNLDIPEQFLKIYKPNRRLRVFKILKLCLNNPFILIFFFKIGVSFLKAYFVLRKISKLIFDEKKIS